MSVLIKYMAMPKGCIYANDKDQTEYCPLLNHDDVPFCQYIENEPESAIGIDERPVYCPLSDVHEPCQDAVSRQAAIDAMANTLWHYPNECYRNLNKYEFAKGLAELGLKSVPSAWPEIIRCKDCKYYSHPWHCEAWNNSPGFPAVSDEMFCSMAERRTDERTDQ